MRGQILVFNAEKQAGAIADDQGQRYVFHLSDWLEDLADPARGLEVNFSASPDSTRARQVQLAPQRPIQAHAPTPTPTPADFSAPRLHAAPSVPPHVPEHAMQGHGDPRPHQPPAHAAPSSTVRKSTMTLLAWFLGWAGGHRFYMGAWGWGLVQLLGLPLMLGLFFAALPELGMLMYVIYLIFLWTEVIRYIWMSDVEFDAKVQRYQAQNPGPFSFFW